MNKDGPISMYLIVVIVGLATVGLTLLLTRPFDPSKLTNMSDAVEQARKGEEEEEEEEEEESKNTEFTSSTIEFMQEQHEEYKTCVGDLRYCSTGFRDCVESHYKCTNNLEIVTRTLTQILNMHPELRTVLEAEFEEAKDADPEKKE